MRMATVGVTIQAHLQETSALISMAAQSMTVAGVQTVTVMVGRIQ